MADPFTITAGVAAAPTILGWLGIGAGVAGGAVGAAGAMMKGGAESGMYGYQAGLAKMNATIARQNASWAAEVGDSQALISGRKTGFQVATAKTIQADSGLDVNTGSAAKTRQSMTEVGQEEQQTIRTNAARRAYGFEVEGASKDAEIAMDETAGINAKKAGTIGALTSILGSASSVSSKWMQGDMSGMFSSKSSGDIDFSGNPF